MPKETERIKHLASRYEEVCKHLHTVATSPDASDSEFWKIIHHPGYTTLADIELATGLVNAMQQQANALVSLNQTLVTGARGGLQKAA